MAEPQVIREVFDLTDPDRNILFGISLEEARERVAAGDVQRIREIDGHFAIVARRGQTIRLARSLVITSYSIHYTKLYEGCAPGRRSSRRRAARTRA